MTQDDPYRAPGAEVKAELEHERLPIVAASRWRRFFNLIIDYVGMMVVVFLVTVVAVIIGGEALIARLDAGDPLLEYGITFGAMFAYYVPTEALFGFTLGKWITGTRVVNENGGRPSWGQVLGRTFARLIPFEAFSFFFGGEGRCRGWHDALAKTWVVRRS